jgi:cytochrome c oxidase subunit 4
MSRSEPSVVGYVLNWAALLCLTGLTWGLAHVQMGGWNTVVALGIAVTKGSLITLFFMHLIRPEFVHRAVLGVALAFLVLLVGLVLIESSTRFPLATPPGSTRALASPQGQLD